MEAEGLSLYDYELPAEAIAQEPLAERDASRLLHLDRATSEVRHHVFRDLPHLLSPGDLLVVNRSRVFPARLRGRRAGGGAAELLLLRPAPADPSSPGPESADPMLWEALVRPGRRLRPGDRVEVDPALTLRIESGSLGPDGRRLVRFLSGKKDVTALLDRFGHTPLPPYIRRPDRSADRERYQTVYAQEQGSVAAPTAGLHFTEALLARLQERGIERAEVVLHVGPGTFRPLRSEDVARGRLAPEVFSVPAETVGAITAARARGGKVVAVGTTTVRALESLAREGLPPGGGAGETDLLIAPGFQFRAVDVLITNFHLPRSSLLLLVAAFAGRERVLAAYAEALQTGYRFYSYGDAMLIA